MDISNLSKKELKKLKTIIDGCLNGEIKKEANLRREKLELINKIISSREGISLINNIRKVNNGKKIKISMPISLSITANVIFNEEWNKISIDLIDYPLMDDEHSKIEKFCYKHELYKKTAQELKLLNEKINSEINIIVEKYSISKTELLDRIYNEV